MNEKQERGRTRGNYPRPKNSWQGAPQGGGRRKGILATLDTEAPTTPITKKVPLPILPIYYVSL